MQGFGKSMSMRNINVER